MTDILKKVFPAPGKEGPVEWKKVGETPDPEPAPVVKRVFPAPGESGPSVPAPPEKTKGKGK